MVNSRAVIRNIKTKLSRVIKLWQLFAAILSSIIAGFFGFFCLAPFIHNDKTREILEAINSFDELKVVKEQLNVGNLFYELMIESSGPFFLTMTVFGFVYKMLDRKFAGKSNDTLVGFLDILKKFKGKGIYFPMVISSTFGALGIGTTIKLMELQEGVGQDAFYSGIALASFLTFFSLIAIAMFGISVGDISKKEVIVAFIIFLFCYVFSLHNSFGDKKALYDISKQIKLLVEENKRLKEDIYQLKK